MKISKEYFMEKMLLMLVSFFAFNANASDTYEARFKCSATPQLTNSTYVHANSDAQALGMANEYINSNTGYKNKGCSVIDVKNQSSRSSMSGQSKEARYEVKFRCSATPQLTNSTYVSATSETQAALEGKKYFDNNTGYQNKGCSVTEVRQQ